MALLQSIDLWKAHLGDLYPSDTASSFEYFPALKTLFEFLSKKDVSEEQQIEFFQQMCGELRQTEEDDKSFYLVSKCHHRQIGELTNTDSGTNEKHFNAMVRCTNLSLQLIRAYSGKKHQEYKTCLAELRREMQTQMDALRLQQKQRVPVWFHKDSSFADFHNTRTQDENQSISYGLDWD